VNEECVESVMKMHLLIPPSFLTGCI